MLTLNSMDIRAHDSLAGFTNPGLVIPALRGHDLPSVIKELSEVLRDEGWIPDLIPFYHAALNREYLCSTATGDGLGFPHAPVIGLPSTCFAFGKLDNPIPWGSKGSFKVRFVFLSAMPAHNLAAYLTLATGFAKIANDRQHLGKLAAATEASEIFSIFEQVKLG
jgi:nitrogen PTS system EIIA component